jgi:protein-S-isoprenylcysteine O-methyltransferase Ste14
MTPAPTPFRWTERRVARLSTLIVAGAVVVLDVVLFFVFLQKVAPMLQDLPLYRYMIPAGILAVFLFALRRFLTQLRLFREDL